MTPRKRAAINATELMAQLASDEQFRARQAEQDAAFEEQSRLLSQAEAPIIDELRSAGVRVDSVWDLVAMSTPYPDALPILLRHFTLGEYPDRVMESLGRALAVKPAVKFWRELKKIYLSPRSRGQEVGAAVALAASATAEQLNDLIELAARSGRGESRIYFIRPIVANGGPDGRRAVMTLKDDPVLQKEAQRVLKEERL